MVRDLEIWKHRSGREVVVHGHSFGYVTVRNRDTMRRSRIKLSRMQPPEWEYNGVRLWPPKDE